MPHIYGSEITVERVLNKSGSGSYKIKNAEGKVVDQKKATLDAIRCVTRVTSFAPEMTELTRS